MKVKSFKLKKIYIIVSLVRKKKKKTTLHLAERKKLSPFQTLMMFFQYVAQN